MKRTFKQKTSFCYGEMKVIDAKTGKQYTLTQRKTIITANDFETIARFIAVDDCCPVHVVPERDFYVYMISFLGKGCVLTRKFVSQEIMDEIISKHCNEILQGKCCFEKYFEEAEI